METPSPVSFESQGAWCIGHTRVAELSDMNVVTQFESECLRLVADQRPRFVALNLSGVNFLVTRALSALLMLHKRQRESGGCLALCGLDANVIRVLRITRLDRVFDIYPDIRSLLAERPAGTPSVTPAPGFGP